ncbi:MAG: DUF1804 family protein [Desulfuromonadaceae bacterium]|nr:DUF1804 family protein [Desulfuromonadaceae bacterium]
MAEKGARAELEPLVRQKYIETGNLALSAEAYGVSRQSASDWKGRTKKPGETLDEWDKARERKSSFGLRMETLLERELTYAEERLAGAVEGGTLDNLSKLGALVVKFKTIENTGSGYDKGKVFLENLQWIIAWLRENDPEGLKTLAADFDALMMQFKVELLGGAT